MLRTALTLATRGLHVFPCRPRGKLPATSHGCRDATTDSAVIREWWRDEPQYNIAIATGTVSKIFVVDIDGLDAEATLVKIEAKYTSLPPTVEAITGKGRHLYFQMPAQPINNSVGKLGPGLDIRATGGYVVAPPSIHPSGRRYAWSVDSASSFAEAPQWLIAMLAHTNGANSANGIAAPVTNWHALAQRGADDGQRNDTFARLAGYLLRRCVDAGLVLEMLLSWNKTHCRPPLDDDEVVTIVNSIAGREIKRRGAPRD